MSFLFIIANSSFATHNRAGEIIYKRITDLTYEFTIITYTFTGTVADRCKLEILWGDGEVDSLSRVNGASQGDCDHFGVLINDDVKKNIYIGRHTYSTYGEYKISVKDHNRNAGVRNIPHSVEIPIYYETTLNINPFLGINTSPVLLNPPIDNACVGKLFIHNPGAWDIDGDSISYKLVECKQDVNKPIIGYTYPPTDNSFYVDAFSGDLIWDSPVMVGEYNVAILIQEWRSGFLIGSIIRDMQILVSTCSDSLPKIRNLIDTCVEAGKLLSFPIVSDDYSLRFNNVTLTAKGGPLILSENPASFNQPVSGYGSVSSVFSWNTVCNHVRKFPYQMYFKAEDDGVPVELVDIETVMITVVGPAPENTIITPNKSSIDLKWNKSLCANVIGYSVYRRTDSAGFAHGYCQTGVPSDIGYVKIGEIDSSLASFSDDNAGKGLIHGIKYCYLITAYYDDISSVKGVEGYATMEICTSLVQNLPIPTNVSVNLTDDNNGKIQFVWSKPLKEYLLEPDSTYSYHIYKKNSSSEKYYFLDSINNFYDTTYVDSLINTVDSQYYYKVYLSDDLSISAHPSSSIFLSIYATDNKNQLSWDIDVPWTNNEYAIYRKMPDSVSFDSLLTVNEKKYSDTGLVNGKEYCYYIISKGGYSLPNISDPLFNSSQELCSVPVDNVPPCPPILSVNADCELVENNLSWKDSTGTCSDDVSYYSIYYSPSGNVFSFINSVYLPNNKEYDHSGMSSIAGCYYIESYDSSGNQSANSNHVCVDIDSCDLYHLPNIFTPDNDEYNQLFKPFPYNFVESIDIVIFNRWGRVVFKSKDPDINWDGKHYNTNENCSDGVYYYICKVNEIRLRGIIPRRINGFVHLIRK